MVKDKHQILQIVAENKAIFRNFGADRIGLFGSFITGEQTSDSDVDLVIDFIPGQKSYRNLLKLADLAESLVGRQVDVLTPQSLSPFIAPYIEKEIEYVQTA